MKRLWLVFAVIALALLIVLPVAAAKPGGEYLGKFAVGDEVAFAWTTDAALPTSVWMSTYACTDMPARLAA